MIDIADIIIVGTVDLIVVGIPAIVVAEFLVGPALQTPKATFADFVFGVHSELVISE